MLIVYFLCTFLTIVTGVHKVCYDHDIGIDIVKFLDMLSFSDFLLAFLNSSPGSYKKLWMDMAGYSWPEDLPYQKSKKEIKENTMRIILSRLKKRGFVENDSRIWKLTKKGKEYLEEKLARMMPSRRERLLFKTKKKNLIVAFDIPETMRRKRDWLRNELAAHGFEQLQKSVWFGPGPLPQEFIEDCQRLDIPHCLRFFQATKKEIIGEPEA